MKEINHLDLEQLRAAYRDLERELQELTAYMEDLKKKTPNLSDIRKDHFLWFSTGAMVSMFGCMFIIARSTR